jgi:hypothetical protein
MRLISTAVHPIVDENLGIRFSAGNVVQLAVLGDLDETLPEVQVADKARGLAATAGKGFVQRLADIKATKELTARERFTMRAKAGEDVRAALQAVESTIRSIDSSIADRESGLKPPVDSTIGDSAVGPDFAFTDRYAAMSAETKAAFWARLDEGDPAAARIAQALVRVGPLAGIKAEESTRALHGLNEVRNGPALAEIRQSRTASHRLARTVEELRHAIDKELSLDRANALSAIT